MKYLAKIIASDQEGLQMISACSSGAKVKIADIKYLASNKVFLLSVERIKVENENEDKKVNSILRFDFVDKVRSKNIDQSNQEEVLELISSLNNDCKIDAILLQLPLPEHLNEREILEKISFVKDVDGLTAINQGRLFINTPTHIPCTPQGVMHLLDQTSISLSGKVACVIGRSTLVGSPIARLLLQANASVIQIHSKTVEPKKLCLLADVVVVACGKACFVDDTWIKKGAIVIDVGIHRTEDGLCGDVNFEKVSHKARCITPVPGGVGPMTIACLLKNTLHAYEIQINS